MAWRRGRWAGLSGRDRAWGPGQDTGGAGVGRRGCWTRLLGRESVGAVEEDMGQEWKEGPAVQLLQNPA